MNNKINIPIILNGGINSYDQINEILKNRNVDAVGVGAFFIYYGPHNAVLISYIQKMKDNYKNLKFQICKKCIMDTAENIIFDTDGVCNFCKDFEKRQIDLIKNKKNIDELVKKIKQDGKNKRYDCIIGVSGGVDSSFSLIKACDLGLRPLAVHLDNGWNSELAQNNISRLIRKCKVDLYTHVINWKEYRNLQQAFFDADVIDIELLMDNAMLSVNYKMANKYKIKYILSGTNTATEGFKIPVNWSWFKNDAKNIKSINNRFSNQKLKTFPSFGTKDFIYFELLKKIQWILFPDYFNYSKKEAIDLLKKRINFRPYPYKHYGQFLVIKHIFYLKNLVLIKENYI